MNPDDIKKEICWVVAGHVSEFTAYVKRKQQEYAILRQECPYDYRYVSSVDSLRGCTITKGFFIGSWRNRPDIKDIQQTIAIQKDRQTEAAIEEVKQGFASTAAGMLAQEIDAEVLRQLMSKPATGPEWRAVVNDGSIFEYLAKS